MNNQHDDPLVFWAILQKSMDGGRCEGERAAGCNHAAAAFGQP